jgi:hypothetical protein
MAPPSSDLVRPLLLLLLVTSSGVEPYPLLHLPRHRSPSSFIAAQQLGPVVESQDLGARPLPDGETKRMNHQSTRLPHGLNKSGGILEPDRPASGDGSASSGGGAARDGVGEVGAVVAVHGVLGVGPMDRWRCVSSGVSPAPLRGR